MRNTAPTVYTAVPIGVTVCSGHVRRNQRSRCRNTPGHLRQTIGHVPGITGHVGPEYSTSGYSRSQITRLVGRWESNRLAAMPLVKRYGRPAVPFARKYTGADVELLVEMDRANEDVCGVAIVRLLRRALTVYGDPRYERLSKLSVSHLYNLRKSAGYQKQRIHFTKTRTVCNPIGVRKAPRPNGRAGWVRIDSVHQGDLDGIKGGLPHHLCGCGEPVAGTGLCAGD